VRRLQLRRWQTWILPALSAIIVIEGITFGQAVVVVAGAAFGVYWLIDRQVLGPRRVWSRHDGIRGAQQHTFCPEEVTSEMLNVKATFAWAYLTEVTRSGDAYVLVSKRGMTIIPRRAFEDPQAEQEFRSLVVAGTGTAV
jgi:YcxB-like protein